MTTKVKRPRTVTITLLGVFLFGVWSAVQALAMAQQASVLLAYNIRPDPRLLLTVSAGWSVLFFVSAAALWRRYPFTRWLIPSLIFLFALYELALQGLFVQTPLAGQAWLLRILLYDMALLFTLWSLNRRAAKSYFSKTQQASAGNDESN